MAGFQRPTWDELWKMNSALRDELAAARLAGKVEGMEEAARIANAFPCTYEDGVSLHAENMTCARIASAIRAKITELKAKYEDTSTLPLW